MCSIIIELDPITETLFYLAVALGIEQEALHFRYFMARKPSSYTVFSPFLFKKLVYHSMQELTNQSSLN